jgi:hypothetical protein
MKIHDTVFGLIFLALGTLVLFAIRGFPNIPGQPVGPALFPGLVAIGLCITGLMLVIKGIRHQTTAPWFAWEDWVHSPRHVLALCVLLASVVFAGLLAYQFSNSDCTFQSASISMATYFDCCPGGYLGSAFCFLQTTPSPPALGSYHALGLVIWFTSLIQSVA